MNTFGALAAGKANEKRSLVIAYGSNLDPRLLVERIGPAAVHQVLDLPGYKLAFAGHSRRWGGAVATLIESRNSTVPVVIYSITNAQRDLLDANEGVGIGVYRRERIALMTSLGPNTAYVYLHNSPVGGKPTEEYVDTIRYGYKVFRLDETKLNAAVRGAR